MSSKQQKMEYFIEEWLRETGNTEIDMHQVAKYALAKGFRAPKVLSEVDLLAREFSQAAREKTRIDEETGRPYRAYHVFKQRQGEQQLSVWVDIDRAPRPRMLKSLQMRREQMIGDAVAVTNDADHWNRIHPTEDPIQIELDFTPDVAERRAAEDHEEAAE
jgi:hypothetical protein